MSDRTMNTSKFSTQGILVFLLVIVAVHFGLFVLTTHLPDSQRVDEGIYQRDMAEWYVPMADSNFANVPAFTATRWLTPVMAGRIPVNRRNQFLLINIVSLMGAFMLFGNLLYRKTESVLTTGGGMVILLWGYGCRYIFYNPFVPDGMRYLSSILVLCGLFRHKRWLLISGFILAAINHESILMLLPLVFLLDDHRSPGINMRTGVLLAAPVILGYALNKAVISNLFETTQGGGLLTLFTLSHISEMVDTQGGLQVILKKIYSTFSFLGIMFVISLTSTSTRDRALAVGWCILIYLQLFIASDTQRMVGIALPIVILVTLTEIQKSARLLGKYHLIILAWIVLSQWIKSFFRFDTRSDLNLPVLYTVNYDHIELLVLLISVPLIIIYLKKRLPADHST